MTVVNTEAGFARGALFEAGCELPPLLVGRHVGSWGEFPVPVVHFWPSPWCPRVFCVSTISCFFFSLPPPPPFPLMLFHLLWTICWCPFNRFMCWSPSPQVVVFGGGLWGGNWIWVKCWEWSPSGGTGARTRRWRDQNSFLVLWGYGEKAAVLSQEVSPH